MDPRDRTTRQTIINACLKMNATGLNQGTSGNISLRTDSGVLITPTSMAYVDMTPDDIAHIPDGGREGAFDGPRRPSSEWRFHTDIYAARSEVNAIVHTHSTYATVLSMLRWPIPACHYMIAAFGGQDIRCSDYAIYGSADLSAQAVAALSGRFGCLLGTHGAIALGATLEQAMWRAEELETLAKQYYLARQIGDPVILEDDEIARVADKMGFGYGHA